MRNHTLGDTVLERDKTNKGTDIITVLIILLLRDNKKIFDYKCNKILQSYIVEKSEILQVESHVE